LSDKYYKILGISPTDDQNVIKKAYRKLALEFHPDKNPDPGAAKRFLEISEAYDFLINKKKTSILKGKQYDFNDFTKGTKQSVQSDFNERMRQAKMRYEYLKKKEHEDNEKYYNKIAHGKGFNQFKIVLIGCTLLSFIFLLDYFVLPTRFENDVATHGNRILAYGGLAERRVVPIATLNDQRMWIRSSNFGTIQRNQELILEKTRFFRDVKYIWVYEDDRWHRISTDFSVTGTFPLAPLFLLIPLITYFIRGRTLTYSVLFNLSFYFFGVILIILMISNERWLRLFSLGFV
jgi:hypothetical protein